MKPTVLNFIQEVATGRDRGNLFLGSGFMLTCGSRFKNTEHVPDPGLRFASKRAEMFCGKRAANEKMT
jgi:hypothetical protein